MGRDGAHYSAGHHDVARVCSPGKAPCWCTTGRRWGNAEARRLWRAITAGPASLTIPACRSCSPAARQVCTPPAGRGFRGIEDFHAPAAPPPASRTGPRGFLWPELGQYEKTPPSAGNRRKTPGHCVCHAQVPACLFHGAGGGISDHRNFYNSRISIPQYMRSTGAASRRRRKCAPET